MRTRLMEYLADVEEIFTAGSGSAAPLRKIAVVLLTLCCAVVLLPSSMRAAPGTQAPPITVHGGGDEWGIELILVLTSDSTGMIGLDAAAQPLLTAPELTFRWTLPEGGTLLDGPASEAVGAVASGERVKRQRRVRLDEPGTYTIEVAASFRPDEATHLTAVTVLFATLSPDGQLAIVDLDPRLPLYSPVAQRPTVNKADRAVEDAALRTTAAEGCFDVRGTLRREEKLPTARDGVGSYDLQQGGARAVHHTLVELRELDTVSDDSYGHTVTDDLGNFAFHFCDDDGLADNELELYYRVCAEVRDGDELVAQVVDAERRYLYCFDSRVIESSGGLVDFDLDVFRLDSIEAAVFNIGDALFYARRFWNDNAGASPRFIGSVRVIWQRGANRTGSAYSDRNASIFIADHVNDPDEWDDSVIIHEWGHFADHQMSCNRNPGGRHTLPGLNTGVNGTRLAWGEGYPDYYQSAVRTSMPGAGYHSYFIDPQGPTVDLEMRPGEPSDRNEGAVAALLWDIFDGDVDGQDIIGYGHAPLQRVLTDARFRESAQCDLPRFLELWHELGLPTDAATSAAVVQNVKTDYRWWDQVTMVVDNSISMAAGVGGSKLNAVQQLIREQVTDYAAALHGTDMNLSTFNASSPVDNVVFEGRFFAQQILLLVDALIANGADTGCYVDGLGALAFAVDDKRDGDAWLYTDGETVEGYDPNLVHSVLQRQRIRSSIVLLGGCASPATPPLAISGGEKSYLALAADGSQPTGMVPYLLTALTSGGQFLYVTPDQLANAADILKAQLHHTAGAGRWSDYVSDWTTYRVDRLAPATALGPGEYKWIDTEPSAGGTYHGTTVDGVRVILLDLFNNLQVHADGSVHAFVRDGLQGQSRLVVAANILQGNHSWYHNVGSVEFPFWQECGGDCTYVFSKTEGDWFAVTSGGIGTRTSSASPGSPRTYQVLFNNATGEVRYQYGQLIGGDSQRSLIGLNTDTASLVAANGSVTGAQAGTGYKFLPAPPQPTKTYVVDVDPLIDSVAFLLTGYSGSFEKMIVRSPDGTAVDCTDNAFVRCVSLNDGLVQFVQVNTSGRGGQYEAVIDAGPTGEGTFSFNALAASPLRVESLIPHILSLKVQPLRIDLGRPFDENVLQAWFEGPNGAVVGTPLTLYDDGNHDDGPAGDGIFALPEFSPATSGVAYLWVEGSVDGVTVRRSDLIPHNFQPLDVEPSSTQIEAFYDEALRIGFSVTNQNSLPVCFSVAVSAPSDWAVTPEGSSLCLDGGGASPFGVTVLRQSGDRLGERGEVVLTLTEQQEEIITGSAAVEVAFFRQLAGAQFDNRAAYGSLRPNGTDTADLTLQILDDLGNVTGRSVEGLFQLRTTLGSVETASTHFVEGRLPVLFTAGLESGVAEIIAEFDGGITARTSIEIKEAVPALLELSAAPLDLRNTDVSQLDATLRDAWGEPVAGAMLRFSVGDDDGDRGTIDGGETAERVTDDSGHATTRFVKTPDATGAVIVRVEAGSGDGVVDLEASVRLLLSDSGLDDDRIYLPIVER